MVSRYLIYIVTFVAVAILFFIRAWGPMPVESLRHRQFDLFQNMKPREKTQLPIVIAMWTRKAWRRSASGPGRAPCWRVCRHTAKI